MKDRRFLAGVVASTIWIGFAIWALHTQDPPTKLNEWGDFIAGFSAPLAFLWLVLGYMQQGDELKQNTKALRLQAEELRNSVQQQADLVEVSRQQLAQEAEKLDFEKRQRLLAARPNFVLQARGVTADLANPPRTAVEFGMMNVGNSATEITGYFRENGVNFQFLQNSAMSRGTQIQFRISCLQEIKTSLLFIYRNADGISGSTTFDFCLESYGPSIGAPVTNE